MQQTVQYLSNSRVAEDEHGEGVAFLERQLRWEHRLAELRRPRLASRPAVFRRFAA
jgi:hypothetical protein